MHTIRSLGCIMRSWFVALAVLLVAALPTMAQRSNTVQQTLSAPAWAFPGALMDFNFANGSYWYSGRNTGNLLATTRASVGYAQNSGGLLISFGTGVPRITDKGLLIEETRTNSAIQSRVMTNVAWTASNMTVATTATGADGVANTGTTLTSTAGNGTVLQSITLASAAYTYSVWLKRISGSGNVDITVDNGTTWTTQTLTTAYQQFQVTKTAANPIIGIRLVTSGDSVAADFNQLEAGSFATTPITTTTIAVARAADVITLNSFTGLVSSPLSLYTAVNIPQTNGAINWRAIEVTDGSATAQIRNNGGTTWIGVLNAGTVNGTAVTTGRHKIATRQSLNDLDIAVDGTLSVAITSAADMGTITRIDLGNTQTASPRQLNGYLERMAIWNYGVSNGVLSALSKL